jgi:hypothetical protein
MDFVEEKRDGLVRRLRIHPKVGVRNHVKIRRCEPRKSLVFEIEVEQAVWSAPCGNEVCPALVEKAGLSCPAHSNNRQGFALNRRERCIASSKSRRRRIKRCGNLLADDLFNLAWHLSQD